MPDPIAGVTPDTVPDTIPDTQPIQKPASSLTTQEATNPGFESEVQSANSPDEVLKLLNRVRTEKAPVKKEDKPAEAKPDDVVVPTDGVKPGEGEPPAGNPDEVVTNEPAAGDPPVIDPDADADETEIPDDGVAPITASKTRLRLPEGDKEGRLAAAYLQRNKDWSMGQAIDAARKQLGTAKPPEGKPDAAANPESIAPTETLETVSAEIERLEAERSRAVKELRFEDTDGLDKQLRKLDRKHTALEREAEAQGRERQAQAKVQYETAFARSNTQAVGLYPDAANIETPLAKKMVEIEKLLEETNDPLFRDPNKPLVVAQMAARELRIAPKAKSTAPVVKPALKPAAPAVPVAKPKGMLPAGGSTTAPVANPHAEMNSKIQSVQNPDDLKKELKKLGISLPGI
jgi:hypothetical protein